MIELSPITDAIKKEFGTNFSTQAHQDSDIKRYLQASVRYIWNYRDWGFNKKIQNITYTVPLSTVSIDFVTPVYSVKLGDEYPTIYDMEGWFNLQTKDGSVACYEDVFIAAKEGTYEILYRANAPTVDSITGQVNLPDRFTDILRMYAVAIGYKDEKKYDRANALIGEVNNFMDMAANRVTTNAPSQLIRMGEGTSWH